MTQEYKNGAPVIREKGFNKTAFSKIIQEGKCHTFSWFIKLVKYEKKDLHSTQ